MVQEREVVTELKSLKREERPTVNYPYRELPPK